MSNVARKYDTTERIWASILATIIPELCVPNKLFDLFKFFSLCICKHEISGSPYIVCVPPQKMYSSLVRSPWQ